MNRGARAGGYFVAALVGGAILYGLNAWPGWQWLPFLNDDFPQVLGIMNASLIVGIVLNLLRMLIDAAWFRALCDIVTTVIGIIVLVRLWQVFPFTLEEAPFNWVLAVRILLIVAIVGSAIGFIAQLVGFVKALANVGNPDHRDSRR